MSALQDPSYQAWIGREETLADEITAWPLAALAATLDSDALAATVESDALATTLGSDAIAATHDRAVTTPQRGDIVPPLWHWLYFLPTHHMSELGPEGHSEKGAFLPPVDLPRRMWAGGRLEFADDLRVGDYATRTSRILEIREKQGRSGRLVFVVVRHSIRTERGLALTEDHDIVYRDHARPGEEAPAAQMAPEGAAWSRTITPSDVLLFRYSALTFNAHRIHYDRRYTVETEHYPGLIVHGPLIATLLLGLAQDHLPGARVTRFEFRAVSPLFDTEPFQIRGAPSCDAVQLWAQTPSGRLAMSANATLAQG